MEAIVIRIAYGKIHTKAYLFFIFGNKYIWTDHITEKPFIFILYHCNQCLGLENFLGGLTTLIEWKTRLNWLLTILIYFSWRI